MKKLIYASLFIPMMAQARVIPELVTDLQNQLAVAQSALAGAQRQEMNACSASYAEQLLIGARQSWFIAGAKVFVIPELELHFSKKKSAKK